MNVAGIIFANMHDSTITDLTKLRTMGSVPFGARYRLIDFPLSNMANSGISTVGVITKANYQSLIDHLGSGGAWDLSRKTGGLRLLPPYGNTANSLTSGGLYRGRLEALANVIRFIELAPVEYVVLSDCDIIANIDYKKVVKQHIEKSADITVVYGRNSSVQSEFTTKTILNIDSSGQVSEVLIRPEDGSKANISMNMFVMGKEFLLDMVKEATSRNLYNFEVDIMQHRCKELKIFGYEYTGYYSQIDSLIAYHRANMELMDFDNRQSVFNPDRPIYTKIRDEAPARYGLRACVENSLIADGCIIEGSVENCVLFRGVRIERGAVVKNSVIMQDSVINKKCEMNFVIADKDVTVGSYRPLIGTQDYLVFVNKGSNA